jgi:alpha-galactosidase
MYTKFLSVNTFQLSLLLSFFFISPSLYSQNRIIPKEEYVILTPKSSPKPRVNGASVFGVRPGSPFLYRIPATGNRPMEFNIDNLPSGLKLDKETGIITGCIKNKGEFEVTLTATNCLGKSSKKFKIKCGDRFGLTPQMGWNHWYRWVMNINDKIIREAADAMINSGLADHGYSYIDIDDSWSNKPGTDDPKLSGELRDKDGFINTNKNFPDMKALVDYIHAKGLKAGIYSSPGPLTCGSYASSYGYEKQDAKKINDWGFDLFKYDLCSYRKMTNFHNADTLKKIYINMGNLLREQPRDIVYNLCEYGEGEVWKWGDEVYANSWRTAYDLGGNMDSILTRVYRDGFDLYARKELHKYAKPGNWNDPDYLMLGVINNWKGDPIPAPLTPNEQYTFYSFWALINAPIIFGGDLTKLDDFVLGLLSNDEVIEVNQDELGEAAHRASYKDNIDIWCKTLEDGSKAVGVFNRSESKKSATVILSDLGFKGECNIRDLWRQKDLGIFNNSFSTEVERHGVVLIKVTQE